MKRFTETTKWRDVWHRRLTTTQKCLWSYLCDICDHAGIFEFDEEVCSFDISAKVKLSDLESLGDRVRHLYEKKWIIVKFIQFQYGKLSPECKPHKPVYAALEKHDLSPEDFEQNAAHRGLVDAYLRDKIITRDGGRCAYTGKALLPSEIAIDHVHPRSKGGNSKPSNLVCMDAKLNVLKADMSLEEFCVIANLNLSEVRERLSNTLSKPLNSLQEKEKDMETDKVTVKSGESAERGNPKAPKITDEEWMASLKANPDYKGINIDAEYRRAADWIAKNPGRQLSRPFFTNWLSKCEKPLTIKLPSQFPRGQSRCV